MQGIRTVYSTNGGMDPDKAIGETNEQGCAVAIATVGGSFSVHVIGPAGTAYAVVSRTEAEAIRDSLVEELRHHDA